MPKIGFIPLDDRPCTSEFPSRISRVASSEVFLPPRQALGSFLTPGNPEMIKNWLLTLAPDLDYLIVSVDMLAYGGLISSRTPLVSEGAAFHHLAVLEQVKKVKPNLQIYAWNVLMRISITVQDNLTARYWEQMNRYSVLWTKEKLGSLSEDEKEQFANLTKAIPSDVRETYFQARRRNHEVNQRSLSLVKSGIIDKLILCQEDAHPIGPHKLEQTKLLERIKEDGLGTKVFLHPGADESGLNLLASAFCDYYQQRPSLAFNFCPAEAKNNVPVFEDIPVGDSVISQARACGLTVKAKDADLNGLIYGPAASAQGLEIWQEQKKNAPTRPDFHSLWEMIARKTEQGVPTIFCDVWTPNGSDPNLLEFLHGKDLSGLASYAGWNTAGNTIGTALAHGTIFSIAKAKGTLDKRAQLEFLIERILDDYVYQSIIRAELADLILANPDWGTQHMLKNDAWQKLNELVQSRLQNWADEHLAAYGLPPAIVKAQLPWPRIFEVRVYVKIREME